MLRRLALMVIMLWSAGCTIRRAPAVDLSPSVRLPERCAVLFFVDGMDRTRMRELLQAGWLPNIKEHFVDGGVAVENAVASMPAVTYPNSVSLLTGVFPGHHGIVGNTWFDPTTLEIIDYIHVDSFFDVNKHFEHPTVYEILQEHLTVSVQFHTRRGVTHAFDNMIAAGIDWYTRDFSSVDQRVGYTFNEVIHLARRKRRWPMVMTYYFPGVDETGHRYGSYSQRYAEALRVADRSIGMVCDALRDSPLAARTYRVLLTDHNHVARRPEHRFDLEQWLEHTQNLRVRTERLRWKSYGARRRALERYDAVLDVGAGRRAALHLRGANGWEARPEQDVLQRCMADLVQLPAIDTVVNKTGPNRVLAVSRRGSAVIERAVESKVRYRLQVNEGDPLGYLHDTGLHAFVAAGWHDSRSWLQATCRTRYPDFVPQVMEMFDTPRAGDLVAFAAEDWVFDDSLSGHGSCVDRDMRVPLFFAGPDLPAGGAVDHARLVDVMPTVLELLGQPPPEHPIDGQSIAGQLRNAARRTTDVLVSPKAPP